MARLIDADELIKLIDDDIAAHKDGYFEDFELPPTAYGSLCALRMAREYIKALPTVEPIKHGHWKTEHLCSTSGGTYPIERCSNCGYASVVGKTKYCPRCGAKMDDPQTYTINAGEV